MGYRITKETIEMMQHLKELEKEMEKMTDLLDIASLVGTLLLFLDLLIILLWDYWNWFSLDIWVTLFITNFIGFCIIFLCARIGVYPYQSLRGYEWDNQLKKWEKRSKSNI